MCPLSIAFRIHVLNPCVSRTYRHISRLNNRRDITQCWNDRCVGRQVCSPSRCRLVSHVQHLHTSNTPAALSTPDVEDSREQPSSDASERLQDDSVQSIPNWKKHGTEKREKVELSRDSLERLEDVFGLSSREAKYILVSCLSNTFREEEFIENLHSLHALSITGEQIYRIPWILKHKPDTLLKKLDKLTERYLYRQHSDGLGFCYLSLERMTTYQTFFKREELKYPNHPNRIYYLADRLKVPVQLLSERIGKPHRTLTMNIRRLDSMIDMFHKYGLQPEDIVCDLWVFEYSPTKAEDRLRRATEIGCSDLRPWMCRCPDRIFDRFCERYQCEKELMGEHKSLIEYLSKRLECEPTFLKQAFKSNIVMKKVHISKFNRIIDLLLSEGITTVEIRSCMRVFQYSAERTSNRIKQLKKIGFFPFPMFLLCHTAKNFEDVIKQHQKKVIIEP